MTEKQIDAMQAADVKDMAAEYDENRTLEDEKALGYEK